jgi:hypothetical protein
MCSSAMIACGAGRVVRWQGSAIERCRAAATVGSGDGQSQRVDRAGRARAVRARSRRAVPPELQAQVRDWETFLNGGTPRERLMARYLYEHLFLAHLYFPSETGSRRSRAPCKAGVDEIATRRPNHDPEAGGFQYCLIRYDGTTVDKTLIGRERERGSAAADRDHGIFTRVLKIQFPAMMSRVNAAAARKFSIMR